MRGRPRGPDFSPEGHSVYFNSEVASTVEGHAQLFRHDLGGDSVEQLTSDSASTGSPTRHPTDVGLCTSATRPAP